MTKSCKCSCCAGNYCEKSDAGSYDAETASDCDAAGCRSDFPTSCPSSGSSGSVSASYTSPPSPPSTLSAEDDDASPARLDRFGATALVVSLAAVLLV
jgi:hypothetical protein